MRPTSNRSFNADVVDTGEAPFYIVQDGDRQEVLGIVAGGCRHEWRFRDLYEAAKRRKPAQVPIESLGILDVDIWFGRTGRKPTLRNIAEEVKRIGRTKSSCPAIIVTELGLVDGTHRALKAYLAGRETLACVEFGIDELKAMPHVTKSLPDDAGGRLPRQQRDDV